MSLIAWPVAVTYTQNKGVSTEIKYVSTGVCCKASKDAESQQTLPLHRLCVIWLL